MIQPPSTAAPAAGKTPRPKRDRKAPSEREPGGDAPTNPQWRRHFLAALIDTSNVSAAARAAGVPTSKVYKTRRENADFAAEWRAALYEGYQNLEMELLGALRGAEPERKLDVAAAMRLLAFHREEAARARALADVRDERALRASIDAMIDKMRDRAAANAAIIAEDADEADARD